MEKVAVFPVPVINFIQMIHRNDGNKNKKETEKNKKRKDNFNFKFGREKEYRVIVGNTSYRTSYRKQTKLVAIHQYICTGSTHHWIINKNKYGDGLWYDYDDDNGKLFTAFYL